MGGWGCTARPLRARAQAGRRVVDIFPRVEKLPHMRGKLVRPKKLPEEDGPFPPSRAASLPYVRVCVRACVPPYLCACVGACPSFLPPFRTPVLCGAWVARVQAFLYFITHMP